MVLAHVFESPLFAAAVFGATLAPHYFRRSCSNDSSQVSSVFSWTVLTYSALADPSVRLWPTGRLSAEVAFYGPRVDVSRC
jgi:hypothetical protein